jgi:hypothetical protein
MTTTHPSIPCPTAQGLSFLSRGTGPTLLMAYSSRPKAPPLRWGWTLSRRLHPCPKGVIDGCRPDDQNRVACPRHAGHAPGPKTTHISMRATRGVRRMKANPTRMLRSSSLSSTIS